MKASTLISDDGLYRYTLTRQWGPGASYHHNVVFVMLNPSTADGEHDDPTIRKCIMFAKSWGYQGLHVVNLFALRATNPRKLYGTYKPGAVGPENNTHTVAALRAHERIVCAWGTHGGLYDRDADFMRLAGRWNIRLYCLGVTKAGHPKHPLFLPGSTACIDFRTARP